MIDTSINKNIDRIQLRLKTMPETPGVYQYTDESGTVIYVGKARNLKRRVTSYFTHYDDHSSKIKMLVRHIYDVRTTIVETEVDALLLENNLIKRYKPKYNSMLKDDKSYPYLCITNEDFPRILYSHKRENVKGTYYGPYPNQKVLRTLQDIIRKLFLYRTCHQPVTLERVKRNALRPCINHQIGLCSAPCGGNISQEEYLNTIRNIQKILRGDFDDIVKEMTSQMLSLAEEYKFEEAEVMKQKIRLLKDYQSKSTIVDTSVRDVDVYSAITTDEKYAYVNVMRIKNGSIIYSLSTEIKTVLDETEEEILATAIPQLHQKIESTAKEIIVPYIIKEIPEEYLKQIVPTRGDKKQLLELSIRNVKEYQHQCNHQRLLVDPESSHLKNLEKIQKALKLKELPKEIECFDNSNIQGAYPVAAMVHFTNGKPNKNEYRRFNIKTVSGPDDYASMAEVIERRYSRLVEEGKPLPNLLIVDGGAGQMEVARKVIVEKLNLDIPIAGLAKDDKHRTSELFFGFPPKVVGLKPTDTLFHLLEQIQNEVHRFAITFHREKRSKGTFKTELTDIPGIGEKTARELLLKFGSVKQIKIQTEEQLATIVGASKAQKIKRYFNK